MDEDGEVVEQVELQDWWSRQGKFYNIGDDYWLLELSGSEWAVFNCIMKNLRNPTNDCRLKAKGIATATKVPYRSVLRALRTLQNKRLVRKAEIGGRTVIVMNPRYVIRGKKVLRSVLEVFNDEER